MECLCRATRLRFRLILPLESPLRLSPASVLRERRPRSSGLIDFRLRLIRLELLARTDRLRDEFEANDDEELERDRFRYR